MTFLICGSKVFLHFTHLRIISIDKLLKAAAPAIAEPLKRIFNVSIASGKFPMEWKAARLTPIFKKGQRSMLDNYRPISILPVISKLMERILYEQMCDYFKKQNILSKHQFGFRQFHSTTTTLLDCTNEWYINMDRGLYNIVCSSRFKETI